MDEKKEGNNHAPTSNDSPLVLTSQPQPTGVAETRGETEEPSKALPRQTEPHKPPGPATPPSPVDHGPVCWLQVVASFAMWSNSWGIVNSFGAFQTYYEVIDLSGKSPSEISWIGSLQIFLLMLGGSLVGPFMDAGYFSALNFIGNFFVVFGLMMTSVCKEYWQAVLAQGIVVGIGCGFLFLPAAAQLPQYFVKRRALASCIAAAGSGVGGLIYPIIFRELQPVIGFGWTVRVIAFVTLLFGLVANILAKNKIPPKKARNIIDPDFYQDPSRVVLTVSMFFAFLGLYVPTVYIGVYALELHITGANLAFYLVAITQAASVIGRIGPSLVADRFGPINMIALSLVVSGILGLCWIAIRNTAGLIVFAILYGTFFGMVLGLVPPAYMTLMKGDMARYGVLLGNAMLSVAPAALIGNPISGAILRSDAGVVGLQAFSACLMLLSGFIAIAARVLAVGWGVKKI